MKRALSASASSVTSRVTRFSHPAAMQTFRVKAGVHCEVVHVNDRRHWRSHVTKRQNTFDEPVSRTRTFVVFRSGRWFLRVKRADVMVHNGIRWVRME